MREDLITALMGFLVPALAGWVWNVQNRVTAHDEIIRKIDQLVTLLLQDRLKD